MTLDDTFELLMIVLYSGGLVIGVSFINCLPLIRVSSGGKPLREPGGWRNFVFVRSSWTVEAIICLSILVLPTGGALTVILMEQIGVCTGFMATGIVCDAGFLSRYLEVLVVAFEVSFILVGFGFVWIALNVLILFLAVFCVVKAVVVGLGSSG